MPFVDLGKASFHPSPTGQVNLIPVYYNTTAITNKHREREPPHTMLREYLSTHCPVGNQ